jgi:N-acetyl-anhydromuramyl-L-alanine amidase AmpD
MTEFLPALLRRPSPNFSSRHGTRVDLLVLHDCEGGCEGSVRWFELSGSSVSAHYVVREDGVRQRKWSTSPTMPGMHALSIGAPLASRWVAS